MVRRRAADAGIETAIGCHTFRATGITDYLTNGGRIEVEQLMAGHFNGGFRVPALMRWPASLSLAPSSTTLLVTNTGYRLS
jgi:hypothetical protein